MTASGGRVAARTESGATETTLETATTTIIEMHRIVRRAPAERGVRLTPTTLGGFDHLGTAIDDFAFLNCHADKHQHHSHKVGSGRRLVEEKEAEHRSSHGKK